MWKFHLSVGVDGVDVRRDVADDGLHLGIRLQKVLDLSDGAENRRVVAALVLLADFVERQIDQRAHQVHGDLPRHGGVLRAALPSEVLLGKLEVTRRLADDDLGRRRIDAVDDDVADRALNRVDGDDLVEDLLVGGELFDRALKPSNVGGDVVGDVRNRLVREDQAELGGLVAPRIL